MTKFSDETYKAMKALAGNGAFRILVDEMREKLADVRAENDSAEGTRLMRNQGKALFLSEFLGACDGAEETVKKILKNFEGEGPSKKVSAIT